jgi:hypothetical protein
VAKPGLFQELLLGRDGRLDSNTVAWPIAALGCDHASITTDAGNSMMQVVSRLATKHRLLPMALPALMALVLSTACRAEDAPAGDVSAQQRTPSVAPAPDADVKAESGHAHIPSAAKVRRPPTHRSVAEGIDEAVRRLTRSLDLDAGQQAKLREILWDEHRQVMNLRSGDRAPGADWVGTTLATVEQAKARIRAMLTEEQKKKYMADVPREQTAPGQADLQHWMDLQDSNRRKGVDGSK